jgi:hypothetical protein
MTNVLTFYVPNNESCWSDAIEKVINAMIANCSPARRATIGSRVFARNSLGVSRILSQKSLRNEEIFQVRAMMIKGSSFDSSDSSTSVSSNISSNENGGNGAKMKLVPIAHMQREVGLAEEHLLHAEELNLEAALDSQVIGANKITVVLESDEDKLSALLNKKAMTSEESLEAKELMKNISEAHKSGGTTNRDERSKSEEKLSALLNKKAMTSEESLKAKELMKNISEARKSKGAINHDERTKASSPSSSQLQENLTEINLEAALDDQVIGMNAASYNNH